MRSLARVAFVFMAAVESIGVPACTAPPPESQSSTVGTESVTNGHLWILNRTGNPSLVDFYTCLLTETNWNQLAGAYSNAALLTLGKEAFVSGTACNPSGPDDQAAFQCAVNSGGFDVKASDLVLIIRTDNNAGGQNDSGASVSVRNPKSGGTVAIRSAEVGTGTKFNTWDYYYVYTSHEVFEAQTDGISADCCDGETASGGNFPWCPECGPANGACGAHQSDLGIGHISCPSGQTYPYQMMSPPGAYAYGSPEFNGTCQSVRLNWSCADSSYNGRQYWTCANGNLHECNNSGTPTVTSCKGLGCRINAAGVDDQCYQASPGWSCASSRGTDGSQYWTCSSDGNIHECSGSTPIELTCARGCNQNRINTNDTCK